MKDVPFPSPAARQESVRSRRLGLFARIRLWVTGSSGDRRRGSDGALQPFRQLARHLLTDFPCAERGRVVFVTAVDDLPTDTMLTIAYFVRDELGARVLLADATGDEDGVGSRLGLPGVPGLRDLMRDDRRTLQELVHPTARPGISCLAAGRAPSDGIATLTSSRVEAMIEDVRRSFDYTLVQLPPVLEDPSFLRFVHCADAVLLLAVEEETDLQDLARGRMVLDSMGAPSVRIVLCAND